MPTQFTKGVIVFKSVYGNVVVGPTAVDQVSRHDRSTDMDTIAALRAFGERAMPSLRNAQVVGTYSGLRPSTEHRDYQIASDRARRWITVGGIRSTGLTASSGIGEHVALLLAAQLGRAADDVADDARVEADRALGVAADGLVPISRAAAHPAPLSPAPRVCNGRVPPLAVLARDYQRRGDGYVEVYGRLHRVTHPISSFGMGGTGAAAGGQERERG